MSVQRESAVINNQIILKCNFRFGQTNDLFDPSAISKVEVLDSDGIVVLETITGAGIIKDATGQYHIVASAITSAKTIYDKWYFTPSVGATAITKTNTCIVWSTVAGSGGLTTLTNLKGFLGIPEANTDDDTELLKIISRVSQRMETKCQRVFLASNYTEYYKGNGKSELLLRQYPINSIASAYDDPEADFGADTAIDTDDLQISSECVNTVIYKENIFSKSNDIENIKITYNAGYSVIPDDVELACIKLCSADYIEAKGGINAIEGETVTYKPYNLRKDGWAMLEQYMRYV